LGERGLDALYIHGFAQARASELRQLGQRCAAIRASEHDRRKRTQVVRLIAVLVENDCFRADFLDDQSLRSGNRKLIDRLTNHANHPLLVLLGYFPAYTPSFLDLCI
jgi:hypothetical protein